MRQSEAMRTAELVVTQTNRVKSRQGPTKSSITYLERVLVLPERRRRWRRSEQQKTHLKPNEFDPSPWKIASSDAVVRR